MRAERGTGERQRWEACEPYVAHVAPMSSNCLQVNELDLPDVLEPRHARGKEILLPRQRRQTSRIQMVAGEQKAKSWVVECKCYEID